MPQFRVTGASRDTGKDIAFTVDATDQHEAMQVAMGLGIMVHRVSHAPDAGAPMASDAAIDRIASCGLVNRPCWTIAGGMMLALGLYILAAIGLAVVFAAMEIAVRP